MRHAHYFGPRRLPGASAIDYDARVESNDRTPTMAAPDGA
jgi:hypothetical protein